MEHEPDPLILPITRELDLHTFLPSDLPELLPAYFEACLEHGIAEVRVIHGKGTGTLREGTHRLLEKLPHVHSYTYPAGPLSGSWGATWVHLHPPTPPSPESTTNRKSD